MHGWGVVCGALVCAVPTKQGAQPTPWLVQVTPGVILGPYGDEIVIDQMYPVDLSKSGGTSASSATTGDPWCSEVSAPCPSGPVTCYLAVKYVESPTRPVRISPGGCGCNDTPCEYSRVRDGFEINCLTSCPPSHLNPPDPATFFQSCQSTCPPCPSDPWVVLARVEFDAQGTLTLIDNCSCRRCVISFAPFWLTCPSTLPTISAVTSSDKTAAAGELFANGQQVTLTITGQNLGPKAAVTISGADIAIGSPIQETGTAPNLTLAVPVTVSKTAQRGTRTLTVTNPNCAFATAQVTIKEARS
jgi:hypothetical protein